MPVRACHIILAKVYHTDEPIHLLTYTLFTSSDALYLLHTMGHVSLHGPADLGLFSLSRWALHGLVVVFQEHDKSICTFC